MNLFSFSASDTSLRLLTVFTLSFFVSAHAITPIQDHAITPIKDIELINSLLEQKHNAIILFYRPSCPLSSYSFALYESLQALFKKQVRWFAFEVNPVAIRPLKNRFNIEEVPFFLFIKNGEVIHHCAVSNSGNMKQLLVNQINILFPSFG